MKYALKYGGVFAAGWAAAITIYVVAKQVSSADALLLIYLVPSAFFFIIGFLAALTGRKTSPAPKAWWKWVIPAIVVDQTIKIFLFSTDWQAMSIEVLPPVFYIQPVHNTLGSYLWVLLDWQGANNWLNAVLALIVGGFLLELWRFYLHTHRNSIWITGFFFLVASGVACNVIDNIFHGGSLDFLTIRPFYVSDLKDAMLVTGMLFMLAEYIDNKLYKHSESEGDGFWLFVKQDISRIIKRN